MLSVDNWTFKCSRCDWTAASARTVNHQQSIAALLIRAHIATHDQPLSSDARPTDSEPGKAIGSAPECLLCTATLARVTALEAEIASLKAKVFTSERFRAEDAMSHIEDLNAMHERWKAAEARADAAEQQIQQLREMLSEAVEAAEDYRIHSETPWVAALAAELAKLDDDGQK